MHVIERVGARRLWDSRGVPALEVEVTTRGGAIGRAIAPGRARMRAGERAERRDGGAAFAGLGVADAIETVGGVVARALHGCGIDDQETVDRRLAELDSGPAAATALGANVTLAVSLAVARAAAEASGVPLWRLIARDDPGACLPLPEVALLAAPHDGPHPGFETVSLVPVGADDLATALDWSAEVVRSALLLPPAAGRLAGVGPAGAWLAPGFSAEDALELGVRAIERAGFAPGEDIALAIAVGADRLGSGGRYVLAAEGRVLGGEEMVDRVLSWLARTPMAAIDDPLAPDDGAALAELTRRAGASVAVRAPALTLGSAGRVADALEGGHGNALALSLLQAGTLTAARDAIGAARTAGWGSALEAEAGESEDAGLAHVAVGTGVERLAAGGLLGGERTAIWNELLRISEDLGGGRLPGRA